MPCCPNRQLHGRCHPFGGAARRHVGYDRDARRCEQASRGQSIAACERNPGRAMSWLAEGGAVNQIPQSSATLAVLVGSGTFTLAEAPDCWEVTSLSLVGTTSSLIFLGIHHCKLLSPAMAMVRHNTMSKSWRRPTSFFVAPACTRAPTWGG